MRLNVEKKIVVTALWLALNISLATSASYADGFYTIIGPDGHPMIVQKPIPKTPKNVPEVKKDLKQSTSAITYPELILEDPQKKPASEKQLGQQYTQVPISKKTDVNKSPVIIQVPKHSLQQKSVESTLNIENKVIPQTSTDLNITNQSKQSSRTTLVQPSSVSKSAQNLPDQEHLNKSARPSDQAKKNVDQTINVAPVKQNETVVSKSLKQPKPQVQEKIDPVGEKHFTEIDGVKYVDNEFLEDREFNLEGKKRFYMTPEVGAAHGRYETIERQKGVSASLLERIRNKSEPDEHKVVTLSTHYFRLPKDEVVKNLEQACFTGKKISKAKSLSHKNQELGLWPVAPIKEHFAYEVVKLDPQIQNVLLTSYASATKVQTYYWPLVVFLDQQGCVIEGVSGFKNDESKDNNTQYAALEGVLRKPEKASYMFLTPLSSAVDVENKQLTNHGQIKLSIIQ